MELNFRFGINFIYDGVVHWPNNLKFGLRFVRSSSKNNSPNIGTLIKYEKFLFEKFSIQSSQ